MEKVRMAVVWRMMVHLVDDGIVAYRTERTNVRSTVYIGDIWQIWVRSGGLTVRDLNNQEDGARISVGQ